MSEYKVEKREFTGRLLQAVMAVAVFIAFILFAEGIAAQAAEGISVEEVNYYNSTITLRLSSDDTRLYLSNGTMKKWEYVPAVFANKGGYKTATMDISWVSLTANYVMSFKGDVSTEPVKVTIPKQATNLKVSYNMASSSISFTNASEEEIEWKKKESMSWTDYNPASFLNQLSTFIDNGATLVFRKKFVNGTSAENPGTRASKEVTLTIPKKTAAPAIVIDDMKLTIALKKGMTYRYVNSNGEPLSDWAETLDSDEDVPLSQIAAKAMYGAAEAGDVYIQFRKDATSSSQMSRNKTVTIPAQEDMTEADLNTDTNSIIEYTGASSLKLIFNTAGENNVLEYCVISESLQTLGLSINDLTNDNLEWNTVKSSTPIVKTKDGENKITEGSLIYYRRKAVKTLGDEGYKLASPAHLLGVVRYPQGAVTEPLKVFQTVEGTCKDGNNPLSFSFYSDSKGDIKTIQFRTAGSLESKGTAQFKVNITDNDNQDSTKKYCYNVTITDLSGVTATNTMLYAYIYFNNENPGDYTTATIKSNAEQGIGLYIYPKTVISNPANKAEMKDIAAKLGWSGYDEDNDQIGYTTKIERVYGSVREDDQKDFRVKLDIGTLYDPDLSGNTAESFTGSEVTVIKLKYDGVEIGASCFDTEYYQAKTGAGKDYRVAILTIHADEIEKIGQIDDRDKDTPVYIYLSNGEVITGLTMNLQRTATANPATFTMTAGNLEAWIVTRITEPNGNVTESSTRNVDEYFRITLNLPSKLGGKSNYSVGVKSVTWDDYNILYSTTTASDHSTITVILDSDLLNRIPNPTTSVTHDIRIEFTNGFVLSGGIPLTVNPGSGN